MLFMDVPFVDLKANYERISDSIDTGIQSVIDDTAFIKGDQLTQFESEFADYLGLEHGIGVASGTDALYLALEAVGVEPGDEVVTVSHTFVSSVDGIVRHGARPRFVDIDPDTYLVDTDELSAAVTEDTAAILPVHLYGQAVDMDPVLSVANDYGVPIIEDSCQAHGAEYKGRRVGTFGDVTCFSFYPSKNLGAFGDGGFVATDDPQLAEEVRSLREYGSSEKYVHEKFGYNSRLDAIQASVLRSKLPHLDKWSAERREAASWYNTKLRDVPVVTPQVRDDAKHVYHLYVVRTDSESEREELRDFLDERGVSTGIHYPIPVHKQKSYQSLEYEFAPLPETEDAARQIVSLPIYPEITEEEVDYVVDCIREFYDR
jgi:dTDP-4-amino-4,6-dideoxygalactose transaminase